MPRAKLKKVIPVAKSKSKNAIPVSTTKKVKPAVVAPQVVPKPATPAVPAKKATPVVAAKPVTKRLRATDVSALILDALSSGPKSRPQLQAAAGCATSSLYRHLSILHTNKQIVVKDRRAPIELAKPASVAAKVPEPKLPVLAAKPANAVVAAPVYVAGALHDALQAVSHRFEAPSHIGEKLHTLEQLSKSMPAAIADVLTAIHADLLRLSPGVSK